MKIIGTEGIVQVEKNGQSVIWEVCWTKGVAWDFFFQKHFCFQVSMGHEYASAL